VSSYTQHLSNLSHKDDEIETMQTEDVKNNADGVMKEITTKRNYMIYAD
jgi:hypothetical protein